MVAFKNTESSSPTMLSGPSHQLETPLPTGLAFYRPSVTFAAVSVLQFYYGLGRVRLPQQPQGQTCCNPGGTVPVAFYSSGEGVLVSGQELMSGGEERISGVIIRLPSFDSTKGVSLLANFLIVRTP